MAKQRKDAERRVRQCERFARLIRITRLLLGHGRWGPDDLAKEIACSPRTIYRDIQTLSMAGIPIHFDKSCQAYRVPEGFRFPGIETKGRGAQENTDRIGVVLEQVKRFVHDGKELIRRMEALCQQVEGGGQIGTTKL